MPNYTPINKGNYSLDTKERDELFHKKLGDWDGYLAYREAWVKFPSERIVPDYPLLVDIELSSLCNLKCPMCYTITDEFKSQVNAKRMEYDLFKKIIDEIGGKVPAVRLSLRGEATLHPRFLDCVRYAKEKGIQEVSTLTHGGKLKKEYAKKLIEAGLDWITVSADGVGEMYESVRQPLKFNTLINNLRDLRDLKDEMGLVKPVVKVQGIWPAINQDPDAYYETFKQLSDLVAFNPLIDYLDNDTDIDYEPEFTCPQQYQRLVIGADGKVMKCSNDEMGRDLVGDVNESTVFQIWHGEKLEAVRGLHSRCGFQENAVCRQCYLPRSTYIEQAEVGGREISIPQYTNRIQLIGL